MRGRRGSTMLEALVMTTFTKSPLFTYPWLGYTGAVVATTTMRAQ